VAATLACQRVALVNLNPQGITTGWYSRRGAEEPVLLAATPTEPDLAVAEAAGVEVLVIDTPPGVPAYLPALAARADVVLGRPDHRPTTCWRPR
jgi:chromosome partitioning protein